MEPTMQCNVASNGMSAHTLCMAKDTVSSISGRSAVDNVASIFAAQRDLRPAAKLIVKGSGLGVEEADILILLYGIRKLGWKDCPDHDGYVNFTDLKPLLVHDRSLFTRRINKLKGDGFVRVRPSRQADPHSHGKAQQVRIEEAGIRDVAPVWERYCQFSDELLKGFTKADLDAHHRVNEGISRIVRERLDPAKQLLGL
jgi:hypothetical protein